MASFQCLLVAIVVLFCGSTQAQDRTILLYSNASQIAFHAALDGSIRFTNPHSPSTHTTALVVPQEFNETAVAITIPWTRTILRLFVKHKTSPNRAARALAVLHVAMYDAIVLSNSLCARRVLPMSSDKSRRCETHHVDSVVAAAAGRVLRYLFVAEEAYFDRVAEELGKRAVSVGGIDPNAIAKGLALGQQIGEANVTFADTDGAARGWNGIRLEWYGEGRYYGPGSWEPTPPYFYYPPEEPFAPGWRTWFLRSPNQYRPAPPDFGSERYMRDLIEVKSVTQNLSADQRKIALFWADGRGSVTPPGHWNNIALELMNTKPIDSLATADVFARLNRALADAFVAAWDAKYAYWTARPITVAKRILGIDLQTAVLTPPFPSYVSGHATFSGAAGYVLGHYFPGKAKQLEDMADEAAMSRLYGGIHFRFDNEDGLRLGRLIGRLAIGDAKLGM